MSYNRRHKIFLQVLMQKGIIDDDESKEIAIQLFENNEVLPIINEINKQLQVISMMIKPVTCEVSSRLYWVLTSTVLNDVARFQTDFTKVQLELLRQIFSHMIISLNGSVSSTLCLNLCSKIDGKLSKTDAKEFLNRMVEGRWLFLENGCYYIGPRSLAELMPYFRTTYEDVFNTCSLCQQVMVHGAICTHCTSLTHIFCLKKYATVQNEDELKCPKCNKLVSTDLDTPDTAMPSWNNNEETIDTNEDDGLNRV